MTMKNRWLPLIVILFLPAGCMGRHVVVEPQKTNGLNDTQWRISQEPSVNVNPQESVEDEKDLGPVQ